jgi:nickel-dependent lactate racemase
MTSIPLAYGDGELPLALDARFAPTVILPHDPPALADAHAGFLTAVRRPHGEVPPLAQLAAARARRLGRPVASVAIAISDHTRAVPDHLLIPWIVAELGLPDAAVTILIGTGTHRGSTRAELERKLTPAVLARFTVVNHDCKDPGLVMVGRSQCGGEAWLNERWVAADLKIATGFIEPHFFAGFSGGTKAIVPGIAGLRTIQHFHRAALIAHPGTTWGDLARNPLQALTRAMTALCPPDFIVNVTLDRAKAITGIFAGEALAAHDAGSARALAEAMTPVARAFPVVVTTNSGHPLDQNFYQTVKGISAAARIVEPGGTIVAVSECRAGLPEEGEFAKLLSDARSSADLLADILGRQETMHDQWQVQTLLQCLGKASVVLHSRLPPADRARTRTEHTDDLAGTLAELHRKNVQAVLPVAVLPLGPLTIPTVVAPQTMKAS